MTCSARGVHRTIYKPDFPVHSYLELQKSKIQIGDHRHLSWETTYQASLKNRPRTSSVQEIDAATLQKTHWSGGNFPSEQQSEYTRKYVPYDIMIPSSSLSRDELNQTHFALGSIAPYEDKRNPPNQRPLFPPTKTENFKEKLIATHFNLKEKEIPKWSTTSSEAYVHHSPNASPQSNPQFHRGEGVKENFQNLAQYPVPLSTQREVHNIQQFSNSQIHSPSTRINHNNIEFDETTTHKWQKTNWYVGDKNTRAYETSHKADFVPHENVSVDPHLAFEKKINLSKDSFPSMGFPFLPNTSSQNQPIFNGEQTPIGEKTAFISHQHFHDWKTDMRTTNQIDYQKKPINLIEKNDKNLQETHAVFGHESIKPPHTLYQDSFQPKGIAFEKADYQAARDFHMGTHSKITGDGKTGITSYQAEFTGHSDVKPSDICAGLKGGHNVVSNEPRFAVRESVMKNDYKVPGKADQASVIDNNLQKSHIQLTGADGDWSTTQQDYFLYESFRMPYEKT